MRFLAVIATHQDFKDSKRAAPYFCGQYVYKAAFCNLNTSATAA